MFLSQITAKKLQVSASGLCLINKRLIISVSRITQGNLWTKEREREKGKETEESTIMYEADQRNMHLLALVSLCITDNTQSNVYKFCNFFSL
jgi:hypothetical protein